MFLTLQFPFGDLRDFAEPDRRLQSPTWPEPSSWQYVHSIGGIKKRNRPGLLNWIGETKFCSADNAIKFSANKADFALGDGINFRIFFRRFFFDGQVSGKFEIGLRVNTSQGELSLNDNEFTSLLKKLFAHPVRITGQNAGRSVSLIKAGRFLAALYCTSTSTQSAAEESCKDDERLIRIGAPLLFVEVGAHERITHRLAKKVAGLDATKASLAHMWLDRAKVCDREVRCWIMHNPAEQSEYARELRIALLRLNASRVGLEAVVEGLLKKIVLPHSRTEASDRLQNYLNRGAERCLKIPDEFKHSNLLQIAYCTEQVITASSVTVLLDTLRNEINVRGQIFSKVEKLLGTVAGFIQHDSLKVEFNMGDTYVAKQVGAQGPNAHAHDMNFNQIVSENGIAVDLPKLAGELERLRNELASNAKTSEHYAEIGVIASAEMEAQKGNGEKAVEALSKTGKWSLGVAEKIGVGLATAMIKTSLGL